LKGQNVYHFTLHEAKRLLSQNQCVFISHRLADLEAAREIADYLKNTVGVNIYFSDQDDALQHAVEIEDHDHIVEYIENGIIASSHLLGVISNNTKGSWWVPFEIGAARQKKAEVAYLLLEEVDHVPSYLEISTLLAGLNDLSKWIKRHIKSGSLWERSDLEDVLPYVPGVANYSFRSEGVH